MSDKFPKISIIIPNYNNSKYLRACLDSVVNQSFRDIEIIVIDDCSTDDSGSIIIECAALDNRVKYHKMPRNSGVGAVRNYGIEAAVGEYLFFLDSDDIMAPGALQALIECAQQTGVDVVVGHYSKVPESFVMPMSAYDKQQLGLSFIYYDDYISLAKAVPDLSLVVIWGKLYRRHVLDGIRFATHIYPYEDVEFMLRLYPRIKTGVLQHIVSVYYRISETSVIMDVNRDVSLDLIKAMDGVITFVFHNQGLKSDYTDFLKMYCYNFIRMFLLEIYAQYKLTPSKKLRLQLYNVTKYALYLNRSGALKYIFRDSKSLTGYRLLNLGAKMKWRRLIDYAGERIKKQG